MISNKKEFKTFDERWEWILSFMVMYDIFVHEILMLMEKRPSSSIATMGVGIENSRIIFYYNTNFVRSLTDAELIYVVTHEVYHVALHHCTHRRPEDPKEMGIWNKAFDLAINTLITEKEMRCMPTGDNKGLLPADFGFPEKLSAEQYIQLLKEKDDDGKDSNGNTYGDSEKDEDGNVKQNSGFDNHGDWNESEMIREIVRNKIEQLSKKEKAWGNMPGDVKSIIIAAQKSYVKWTRYLKQYLGNLVSAQSEATFKRPNKRYGYPYCGKKRMYVDRKLLGIDTSGSVGDKDLAQFLSEINRLAEIQPVDVQCFDHDLQGPVRPFDRKKSKYSFDGRGGTNFEPILKLAEERRYQSLIILTDGYATAPSRPKHVKDVLWVITPDGECPVDWGTVIKIPKAKE